MRAARRKLPGRIEDKGNLLKISFLTSTSLYQAFTEPLKFFIRKEFRRYKQGSFSDLWYDGFLSSRGDTLQMKTGLFQGIPSETRIETDYQAEPDGLVHVNTDFYPSEYTERRQRRRKSVTLPIHLISQLNSLFVKYLAVWNQLVTQDKVGEKIQVTSILTDFEKKVYQDYLHRRSKSNSPLRYKTLAHLRSIPIPIELNIKPIIKKSIDYRSFISGRIIKRSNKKYQISFIYSETKIREVDLKNHTLNPCRDPRLKDIGLAFSKQGLSIVTQDAFEGRKYFIIKSDVIKKTKNFIQEFFKSIHGKVRSIALDSSCSMPKDLVELRKKFVKKCRTMKAEGAAMFYEAPKIVPLGEVYSENLPAHNPNHLKVWEKKALSEVKDYALIQGLTGEPMLVTPGPNSLLTFMGGEVPGLIMANHTLHQAAAKWDMWHGATFLSRASCRTVRKGLNRY